MLYLLPFPSSSTMKAVVIFVMFTLLHFTNAGRILPVNTSSIELTLANITQESDYTFKFLLDSDVPTDGILTVTFPEDQYINQLGLPDTPNCSMTKNLGTAWTSVTCTRNTKIVTFQIGELVRGVEYWIKITDVTNPGKIGGTGSFKLQTSTGNNILDTNSVFGVVGMAPAVSFLSSAKVEVASGSSDKAGEVASYKFTFTLKSVADANTTVEIRFPADYSLDNLSSGACASSTEDSSVSLGTKITCSGKGNKLTILGKNEATLVENSKITLYVHDIQNPSHAGATDQFAILLLRTGTSYATQIDLNIPALEIKPGDIGGVVLSLLSPLQHQTISQTAFMNLRFSPTNPLPSTHSSIIIKLPFNTILNHPQGCHITAGLTSTTTSTDPTCTISLNTLTLTNFSYPLGEKQIQIHFLATLPPFAQVTPSVKIYTYLSTINGPIVDSTVSAVHSQITVEDVSLPVSGSIGHDSVTAGAVGRVMVIFEPGQTMGVGSKIMVNVPLEYNFVGSVLCDDVGFVGEIVVTECVMNANTVTVVTGQVVNTGASSTLLLTTDDGGIGNPGDAGSYVFGVEIYLDSDLVNPLHKYNNEVTITPIQFDGTTSVTPLSVEASRKTVLLVNTTLKSDVPAGDTVFKTYETRGEIHITLPTYDGTNTLFGPDLGLGLTEDGAIECVAISGITALSNPSSPRLSCFLQRGTASKTASPAKIIVRDFQSMSANQFFSLAIPLTNSANNFSATIETVKWTNRKKVVINSGNYATVVGAYAPAVLNVSKLDLSVPTIQINNEILIDFRISGGIGTVLANQQNAVLVEVGSEWELPEVATCYRGSTPITTCGMLGQNKMILVVLDWNIDSATTVSLTFDNIDNPVSQVNPLNGFQVNVTKNLVLVESQNSVPTSPLQAGNINNAVLKISSDRQNAPNVDYRFIFTVVSDVPADGTIFLDFPTDYNLGSTPEPYCHKMIGLTIPDGSSGITCTVSTHLIEVTGFNKIEAYTALDLTVKGVKNPGVSNTNPFLLRTETTANILIDQTQTALPGLSLSSDFQTSDFTNFDTLKAVPTNFNILAEYHFGFKTSSKIPKGGSIQVTFPADYTSITENGANGYTCTLTGNLTTYQSCSVAGLVVTVVLDQDWENDIYLVYRGLVRNPAPGATNNFVLATYYDGVKLEETTTTAKGLTIEAAAGSLTVGSLTFNPQNEGEVSIYTLTCTPSVAFLATDNIIVEFPDSYDPGLGIAKLSCKSAQLAESISCSASNRRLVITGHNNQVADVEFTVEIWGIINPNKVGPSTTGNLSVGIIRGDTYLMYAENVSDFTPTLAPTLNDLKKVESSTGNARYYANVDLTFWPNDDVPTSTGQLFLDFPSNYDLSQNDIACNSNSAYADFIICKYSFWRVFVTDHTKTYQPSKGNVKITMKDVLSPDLLGNTQDFTVATYDATSKSVVNRSYPNLSNPSQLSFAYDGLLIKVNNDEEVTIERGSQTADLKITIEDPCRETLTFSPIPSSDLVTFDPETITMEVGHVEATFRIKVPITADKERYTVSWAKTGDSIPPTYAQLMVTVLNVTKLTQNTITIGDLDDVEVGSTSVPNEVILANAPHSDLKVAISVDPELEGVFVEPNRLDFTPGVNVLTYTIKVSATVVAQNVALVFQKDGADTEAYQFVGGITRKTLIINTANQTVPQIVFFDAESTSRTTASFKAQSSKNGTLHYLLGRLYMYPPTVTDIQSSTLSTNPNFKNSIIQKSTTAIRSSDSLTTTIAVSSLEAGQSYIIYVFIEDIQGNFNPTPASQQFSTIARATAVEFTVRFLESTLSQLTKETAREQIASVLAVEESRVAEFVETCYTPTRRLLERRDLAVVYTDYNLILFPDPGSLVASQSPTALITSVNDNRTILKSKMATFDDSHYIYPTEYRIASPTFAITPKILNTGYYSVSGQVDLKACGTVYIVVLEKTVVQSGRVPKSSQVAEMWDAQNISATHSTSLSFDSLSDPKTFAVEGLKEFTEYTMYISAKNTYPRFPNVMDEDDMAILEFTTDKIPEVISLDGASRFGNLMASLFICFGIMLLGGI